MIINFNNVFLDVDYSYYKAYRGYRNSFGVPEEPDENASVEINSVSLDGKDITELCDAAGIMEDIEGLVWKGMNDEYDYGD